MLEKKFLRSTEVRKMLGISVGTLQNLRVNGTLPYTKVGGIIFYDQKDIAKMLNGPPSSTSIAIEASTGKAVNTPRRDNSGQ